MGSSLCLKNSPAFPPSFSEPCYGLCLNHPSLSPSKSFCLFSCPCHLKGKLCFLREHYLGLLCAGHILCRMRSWGLDLSFTALCCGLELSVFSFLSVSSVKAVTISVVYSILIIYSVLNKYLLEEWT